MFPAGRATAPLSKRKIFSTFQKVLSVLLKIRQDVNLTHWQPIRRNLSGNFPWGGTTLLKTRAETNTWKEREKLAKLVWALKYYHQISSSSSKPFYSSFWVLITEEGIFIIILGFSFNILFLLSTPSSSVGVISFSALSCPYRSIPFFPNVSSSSILAAYTIPKSHRLVPSLPWTLTTTPTNHNFPFLLMHFSKNFSQMGEHPFCYFLHILVKKWRAFSTCPMLLLDFSIASITLQPLFLEKGSV